MTENHHLIVEHRGPVGIITLNRPEALNALTLGMIRGIREVLAEWRDREDIRMILFRGAGERAFCAGGDIKKIYEAGSQIDDPALKIALARTYFADEYRMNRELYHYPKPLMALMDGITMGGGFGVAGPCRYRVATEKTLFAMPEVGIGFFPDVGSVYSLTRCLHKTGYFLGLTGDSIGPADMLALGLATHYMPAERFASCLEQIIEMGDPACLDVFEEEPDSAGLRLAPSSADIDKWFSYRRIEDIFDALERATSPLAKDALRLMRMRSPTSLRLTLAYLIRMEKQNFDTVTAMDYRLSMRCMLGHDFYEGVRAALIDKDKAPRWSPSSLTEVGDDVIENYFADDLPDLDGVPL